MPELPEVETVRAGLAPVMEGQKLAFVAVRRPDLRIPFPDRFTERLTQARITRLARRSKYLWLHLDTQETLIIHLGMSGRMTIDPTQSREVGTHDHVSFYLDSGAAIHFTDPRRFGLMDLCATTQLDQHRFFQNMGPEPLGNVWNAEHLYAAIHRRRSPLKSVLLDQKVVAGLGNIYVCEVLFRAGLHPTVLGTACTPDMCERLVAHSRDVLREAIESGGSTLRDYVRSDGGLGYFQHAFAVYDRAGEACRTPKCSGIIERLVQANRSSFYCPICQPAPKQKASQKQRPSHDPVP